MMEARSELVGTATSRPTRPPFAASRRRILLTIAGAVALVAAVVAVVGRVADYHQMTRALGAAHRSWFAACLLGELLAYAGYVLAYRDMARVGGGPRLGVWTATRVVVLGFGAFVVGSSAGGLTADYWALHRASHRDHQSARRVLGMNTLEWAVLGSVACLSAIAVLAHRGAGVPMAMTLAWLIPVPVCIVLALWCTQPGRVQRVTALRRGPRRPRRIHPISGWAAWLAHGARMGLADAVGGVVVIRAMYRHPRRYWAGIVGFPVYWAGDILTLYAALRAFGVTVAPPALVLAYTTGYVISALPLPAGGAGATEATFASTLNLVRVPFAPALLAAVVYRFFAFWLPIIPALLFLPLVPGLADDLERTPFERSDQPLAMLTGEADR